MNNYSPWNELTRREQRIMIKLFGGGSSHGDGPIETVNLTRLGLITENGLTSAGLKLFIAAFKDVRQSELTDRTPEPATCRSTFATA